MMIWKIMDMTIVDSPFAVTRYILSLSRYTLSLQIGKPEYTREMQVTSMQKSNTERLCENRNVLE